MADPKPAPVQNPPIKKAIHRSPAYPFVPLKKAIERTKALHDAEGRHPVRYDVAVLHWGYKPSSSGALQTVSALRQFGLIQVEEGIGDGRLIRITERGLKILLDQREEEKQKAIAEAALLPKLYADFWKRWGSKLPSDANIESILSVEMGFNPASVKSVVQGYKDTLNYAGVASLGSISAGESDKPDPPESEREDMHEQEVHVVGNKPPVTPGKQTLPVEEEHLRAKLAGGRMVRILFQGDPPTQGEIDKVIALLELSKDQYPAA